MQGSILLACKINCSVYVMDATHASVDALLSLNGLKVEPESITSNGETDVAEPGLPDLTETIDGELVAEHDLPNILRELFTQVTLVERKSKNGTTDFKWQARCRQCGKTYSDNRRNTSNFIRHVKTHSSVFQEYERTQTGKKDNKTQSGQVSQCSYVIRKTAPCLQRRLAVKASEIPNIGMPATRGRPKLTKGVHVEVVPEEKLPTILKERFSQVVLIQQNSATGKPVVKWQAMCVLCSKIYCDVKGNTSNFLRHLKTHKNTAQEQELSTPVKKRTRNELSVSLFPRTSDVFTKPENPKQENPSNGEISRLFALNESLIRNLIIGCGLPLSIAEKQGFIDFATVVDPRWQPLNREAITQTLIPELCASVKDTVRCLFAKDCDNISCTVSFWLDDRRSAFMTVTGHGLSRSFHADHVLLAFEQIKAPHSAHEILNVFQNCMEDFGVGRKMFKIMCDGEGAASATNNFSLPCFPAPGKSSGSLRNILEEEVNQLSEKEILEEESMVDQSAENLQRGLDDLQNAGFKNLPCFFHSLQLVINDGFEACADLSEILEKVSNISSIVYRNPALAEGLRKELNCIIPDKEYLCWSSQLKLVRTVFSLDQENLDAILDKLNEIWASPEHVVLMEFLAVMEPFEKAVDMLEECSLSTIAVVAPCATLLYAHILDREKSDVSVLRHFIRALKESLEKRFHGLLVKLHLLPNDYAQGACETFGDDVYLIAAFLDPVHKDFWVDNFVVYEDQRALLKLEIRDAVVREVLSMTSATISSSSTSPVRNRSTSSRKSGSRLFHYASPASSHADNVLTCRLEAVEEMEQYYRWNGQFTDAYDFWESNWPRYPGCAKVANKILTAVASAPDIERVVYQSGILNHSHPNRLLAENVRKIVFLRCNQQFLKKQLL